MALNISKDMKKVLVCGASLMMLASAGAGISNLALNNTSAHASVTRTGYGNYRHLVNYLHWVQRYNHTHEQNWHSYYLSHLYKYTGGLTTSEFNVVKNLFNRYHMWYYAKDSNMDTAYQKFNTTPKVIKSVKKHNHMSYYAKLRKARAERWTKENKAQYKAINHYLTWVNWFDGHHVHQISSYKIHHLTNYMNYLTYGQQRHFLRRLNKISYTAPRYYRANHQATAKFTKPKHHKSYKKDTKLTKRVRKHTTKKRRAKESYEQEIKNLETPKNKKRNINTKTKKTTPTLKPEQNTNSDNANSNSNSNQLVSFSNNY